MLPTAKPLGLREDAPFSECLTLEELNGKIESETIDTDSVPDFTVLRCALASGKLEKQPTTEELFKSIEDHLPRLGLANDIGLQVGSMYSLSSSPLVLDHLLCHRRIGFGKL